MCLYTYVHYHLLKSNEVVSEKKEANAITTNIKSKTTAIFQQNHFSSSQRLAAYCKNFACQKGIENTVLHEIVPVFIRYFSHSDYYLPQLIASCTLDVALLVFL